VGIYAGNGKVIEAKGSAGGVVVDDIWGEDGSKWKIAMYARPRTNALVSE
jgi:cell wall-associated NlpC family hydrolase